ncbi:MAG: hypothetical protein OXK16_00300 [bacterium]|nr:hypothetical protein [bacterium]
MTVAVDLHAPTRAFTAGYRRAAAFSTAIPDMGPAAGLLGKDC